MINLEIRELFKEYQEKFNDEILLGSFLELDEQEQIKILKMCIKNNERIYENDYFNDTYIEEIED